MRTTLDDAVLFLFVFLAAVSMAFSGCPGPGNAQTVRSTVDEDPPWPPGEDDLVKAEALVLARLYRHEHGFPHAYSRGGRHGFQLDDDMAAMNQVLERVARVRERHPEIDQGYVAAAWAYTRGRIFDRTRTDAACDAPWLDLEGNEPPCWQSRIPWSSRREAWMVSVRHAIDVRLHLVEPHCTVPAIHWGCGPATSSPPRGDGNCRDHERAARAGWVEVSCGVTHNTFYAEAL